MNTDAPTQPPSPTVHCLKCIEPYFSDVLAGRKRFEIRKNDRGFKVGDVLRLEGYDPARREYTGHRKDFRVGYMIEGAPYLPDGLCVMQLVEAPVAASEQPPSPAQRIEAAVESLRPRKCDDMGETDSALATVRAALKEMEEAHKEDLKNSLTMSAEMGNDAIIEAIREDRAQAVAKMEALRPSRLECKADPRKDAFDDAIDHCIKVLKGDQA